MDVERAQHSESRGGCRYAVSCLTCSVLALYALVLAGGALGFWALRELRADVESSRGPTRQAMTGTRSQVPSQMQNFAYIRAISSKVENSVIKWESFPYLSGSTLGSRFRYDPDQATLTVTQDGTYFLYVQLTLKCVHQCHNGTLDVLVQSDGNKNLLTCQLQVPDTPSSPVSQKCWSVLPPLTAGSRLLARMETRGQTWQSWSIDMNQSGLGIFLVNVPVDGSDGSD